MTIQSTIKHINWLSQNICEALGHFIPQKGKRHPRITCGLDKTLSNNELFHFHVYINVPFIN